MRILPAAVFDRFYDGAFPIYKAMVRYGYVLGSVLRLDFLNSRRWRRTSDVSSVMPFSLVGSGGLEATYDEGCRLNASGILGDFVELGVARGGCAALMAKVAFASDADKYNRHLWLFDSYEGLPDPGERDIKADNTTGDHVRPLPKGSCLGTLEEVQSLLFAKFGFNPSKISFVKGWFENTVPATQSQLEKIAMLRIDGDWYESTKVCLEHLYDKVSPGGVIVVDDYLSCIGCKLAVDEFIAARKLPVILQGDGRGGCFFRKPS